MQSKPLWVQLPNHQYPILIGEGLLDDPQVFGSLTLGQQVMIVSQANIAQHYLARLVHALGQLGVQQIDHCLLDDGESHKNLASANDLWTQLLAKRHHRDTTLIALGGGMIGDLTGFAAACYLRGVPFIQCPTSLLAQVDAGLGGKTAINHPLAKNVIGAFHHPQAVIIDIQTLASLDAREFNAGIAELIKYGLIIDADFFVWLEKHLDDILARKAATLLTAVQQACAFKAAIIEKDEKDQNVRQLLNFGHTTAHAIENLLDYQEIRHGEAVALGMLVATQLSMAINQLPSDVYARLLNILKKSHLPTQIPKKITSAAILDKMKLDKKHQQQKLNFVLLQSLGKAQLRDDIEPAQIERALLACGA